MRSGSRLVAELMFKPISQYVSFALDVAWVFSGCLIYPIGKGGNKNWPDLIVVQPKSEQRVHLIIYRQGNVIVDLVYALH